MIGRSTGETYRLGDHVTVRLVEAIPVAGALRFELLSDGRIEKPQRGKIGKKLGRSEQKRSGQGRTPRKRRG